MKGVAIAINVLLLINSFFAIIKGVHLWATEQEQVDYSNEEANHGVRLPPAFTVNRSHLQYSKLPVSPNTTIQPYFYDEEDIYITHLPPQSIVIFSLITLIIAGIGFLAFVKEYVTLLIVYAVIMSISLFLRVASVARFSHYTLWTDVFADIIFILLEFTLVVLSLRMAIELKCRRILADEIDEEESMRHPDDSRRHHIVQPSSRPTLIKMSVNNTDDMTTRNVTTDSDMMDTCTTSSMGKSRVSPDSESALRNVEVKIQNTSEFERQQQLNFRNVFP